jgi:hypothetical protein
MRAGHAAAVVRKRDTPLVVPQRQPAPPYRQEEVGKMNKNLFDQLATHLWRNVHQNKDFPFVKFCTEQLLRELERAAPDSAIADWLKAVREGHIPVPDTPRPTNTAVRVP